MMNRYYSIILLILSAVLIPTAFAAAPDKLAFAHKPVAADLLPEPGRVTTLEVYLPNNRDLGVKLRAEVLIDGVLIDVPMEGNIGDRDRTVYKVTVKAPMQELSYRFHAVDEDKGASSEMFRVSRPCLPDHTPTDTAISEDAKGIALAKELSIKARQLEQENINYNEVLASLKKIDQELQ